MLGGCGVLIAAVWLGLLPALSSRPDVQRRIRDLDSSFSQTKRCS